MAGRSFYCRCLGLIIFLFMVSIQSCRVYEDNEFETYFGQVVSSEGEILENFTFGFGEMLPNVVPVYDEFGLPEARFIRLIYRVRTDDTGRFRIVVPKKTSPWFYAVTFGGSRFVISVFEEEVVSEVSEIRFFLKNANRSEIDLGQIKVIRL